MPHTSQPVGQRYSKPWTQGRAEDLAWMVETGENASGAARRIGITYNALEKWCRRYTPELWQALVSREPCHLDERHPGMNQWAS